jgi:hypothetical protein
LNSVIFINLFQENIFIPGNYRQYIPSKPAKYGIKYWCIVDTECGYLCDVNIYLGKSDENNKNEANVGMKAVLKLCEKYFNTHRCITADNFFTSIPLVRELWAKNLEYLGF